MTRPLPDDHDERLALLAESLEHADLRAVDPAALASEFDVTTDEVHDALRVARVFEEALGEDLPAEFAPPVPLPPGHELVAELGRGGMGVVYRVHHRALGRDVALKTLRAGGPDASSTARFEREIRALARLRHPHIVRVFEGGEVEGVQYFTMELIAGSSLADVIGAGLGIARSVRLLTAIAGAVEHAHEQGLIHRDLKPTNILIDEQGEPFVVDFGLAREAANASDQDNTASAATLTGQIVGTPAYMSPEQAAGIPAGEAADIYALGAVLYECLTTKRPFGTGTVPEVLWRVMHEDAPSPRSVVAAIPRPLEVICQYAMRKDPSRRYTSAKAFAADLTRFSAGEPILAQPPGLGERLQLWLRRRASHLITAALAILLASVLTQLVFGGASASTRAAQQLEDARELENRGDHGAARAAYGAALADLDNEFDRVRTLTAWLTTTSSRAAELLRLGQAEGAQRLLDEAQRHEPAIQTFHSGSLTKGVLTELAFEWLRLGALGHVHPELSWTSRTLDWQALVELDSTRQAVRQLRRALATPPGTERDATLALLLHLDATVTSSPADWQSTSLGRPERLFAAALRTFDPNCSLTPDQLTAASVTAYAESAPQHCRHGAATLAALLTDIPPGFGGPDDLARRPLRASLALIARHDLGSPTLIWEESRDFAGPTIYQVQRKDRLPGPLSILDLRFTLPGAPAMSPLGHRLELGGLRSSIELSLAFTDLDHELWKGRYVHIDVDRFELTPQLRRSPLLRGWANLAIEPGTVVSLGTLETTWKPVDDHRLWTFHLMLAIDEGTAPTRPAGLASWRERIRDSVSNLRKPGRRPTWDNELWSRIDPVIDLAVHDAHTDALWLVDNAPAHAPDHSAPWIRFARTALGGKSDTLLKYGTGHRGRRPASDYAWVATQSHDPAVRKEAAGLMFRAVEYPPAGVGFDLRAASDREGLAAAGHLGSAFPGLYHPGGDSPWHDLGLVLLRPWNLGVLGAIVVIHCLQWLRRRRQPPTRPRPRVHPALWLVGASLLLSCCVIGANGWQLPDWIGPLLAAAGALWWTATAPSPSARRQRLLAAPCFLVAAVMAVQYFDIAVFTAVPLLLGVVVIVAHERATSSRRWERARRAVRGNAPRRASTLTNAGAAQ